MEMRACSSGEDRIRSGVPGATRHQLTHLWDGNRPRPHNIQFQWMLFTTWRPLALPSMSPIRSRRTLRKQKTKQKQENLEAIGQGQCPVSRPYLGPS